MDWRRDLAGSVAAVGPMPRGRYVPEPAMSAEWISGARLMDPAFLHAAITRARPADPRTGNPKDQDPRIGVSRMSRQYCAALTCVALTGLVNGVGIDLSPARCRVLFQNDLPSKVALDPDYRVVGCAQRPTSWPVEAPVVPTIEQLREYVWTNLYARNLGALFATAVDMVNIPERLLWTNAAEWVAIVMDSALEYLPPDLADRFVAECRALLDAEKLPGFTGNPLRGLVEWQAFDDGEPRHGIQTRHLCCLVYLHTDRKGRLCQNCPLLPLPDRAALMRERRGVGKPGGPAELRCMQVGLARRHLKPGRK